MAFKNEEIILDLIKQELEKFSYTFEPRIMKMASLLNIDSIDCKKCIDSLYEKGRIDRSGKKIYLRT